MFFDIFSDKTELPDAWDIQKLWIAEMHIASCVGSVYYELKAIQKEERFKKHLSNLIKEVMEFEIQRGMKEGFAGEILHYAEQELDTIFKYVHSHDSDIIKPRKDVLLDLFEKDPRFKSFIVNYPIRDS